MKQNVSRRELIAAMAAGAVGGPEVGWAAPAVTTKWEAIVLEKGRHLFVDDYLVATIKNLTATLHHPKKMHKPILLGVGSADNNDQPYATVLYDDQRARFRMWYNTRKDLKGGRYLSYIESEDGIHWEKPYKDLLEVYGFACSVTDSGPDDPDPAQRYKLTYWEKSSRDVSYLEDGRSGVGVAFSPDGLNWTKYKGHPVLPDLWKYSVLGDPRKKGSVKWREYAADCVQSTWDPIRKVHVGYVKSWTWPPDEMGYMSPSADGMGRRLASMTISPDFIHWSTPIRCFVPLPDDFPSLEFYGCRPKSRGNQMIVLTCILDEAIKTGAGSHGIGYTVLSTSANLVHWNRMKEPWLDRSAEDPAAADHAMAWAADLITVGDEEYLYYAGYSKGHKTFTDRTMNLARLRKDGFVSRDAAGAWGQLITPLLRFNADEITVNANIRGELRLGILDKDSKPVTGFRKGEVDLVKGNSNAHAIRARGRLSELRGQVVRFEFSLRDGELYAFELH